MYYCIQAWINSSKPWLIFLFGRIQQKIQLCIEKPTQHNSEVKMSMMASQITSVSIVYSAVYSGADQRKYQSSTPLAFVRGIHRWSVNSPHKGPATRKMFPFHNIIMARELWPCIPWRRTSAAHDVPVLRNDIKCKYILFSSKQFSRYRVKIQ